MRLETRANAFMPYGHRFIPACAGRLSAFRGVTVFLCAFLVACASPQPPPNFDRVTEAERAQLGVVGVSSVGFKPEENLWTPCRGTGDCAAKGAGAGVSGALSGGGGSGDALAIVLLPAFMFVGGVVGGMAGAASALPESTAQDIERSLGEAVAASKPRERLRKLVLQKAREAGVGNVIDLGDLGVEEVPAQSLTPEVREAAVDSVLQVGVAKVSFVGESGSDPHLVLHVRSQFRLGPRDGSVEYYETETVIWSSEAKAFSAWSKDEGQAIQDALIKAYRETAERVVEVVFLVYVSPAAED